MKLGRTALVLIWLSVTAAGAGAYLRQRSHDYERWQLQELSKIARRSDGPLIAAAFGTHWGFEVFVDTVLAAVFTNGMLVCSSLIRRGPNPAWVLVAIFASGCILGAWIGVVDGAESMKWGFGLLGVGYWLASFGLILGVVALRRTRPSPPKKRDELTANSGSGET
jgi:hypothetical protein